MAVRPPGPFPQAHMIWRRYLRSFPWISIFFLNCDRSALLSGNVTSAPLQRTEGRTRAPISLCGFSLTSVHMQMSECANATIHSARTRRHRHPQRQRFVRRHGRPDVHRQRVRCVLRPDREVQPEHHQLPIDLGMPKELRVLHLRRKHAYQGGRGGRFHGALFWITTIGSLRFLE